jgi:hypothetical protein
MGAFFGSVHFRTEDRDAVRRLLERVAGKRRCRFLLGPALGGWVTAYPEMHGQDERVVKAVVKHFPGEALHVLVHDDDVFAYTYFQDGKVADEYNSSPDYFGEAPPHVGEESRGRPEVLAHLLAPGRTLMELEALLSTAEAEGALFKGELLGRFADLLGLPNALTSYEYLQAGERDGVEGWDEFLHVPDDSAAKAHKREAEASIDRVKERMRAEGLLLLERSVGEPELVPPPPPQWCPDRQGDGFLVCSRRPGPDRAAAPVQRYAPPWTGPADTGLSLAGLSELLVPSPSGRYLAAGCSADAKVPVWDLDAHAVVAEIAQAGAVVWAGFSPDELFLVTLCWDRSHAAAVLGGRPVASCQVAEVASGRAVASFQLEYAQRAAVHPSGVILVADALNRLTLAKLPAGPVSKSLFVGGRQDLGSLNPLLAAQAQEAVAQLNPDVLEQQMRAVLDRQIKHMEEAARRGPLPPGVASVEEFIARFKQQIEQGIALMRQQFQQRRQAGPSALTLPERGNESVTCLECSADGRLVFVATDKGVRAFAWDALTAATESTPAPLFAAEAEGVAVEFGPGMTATHRMVSALAHDAAGNRLLFGGLEGKVGFLDLATGRSGTLLDPPGRPAVQRLGLSRDRGSLCCTCQPDLLVQNKRQPALLQVWNYAALEQRLRGG